MPHGTSARTPTKKMIRDKYAESDGVLKSKVGEIEDGIKNEKREKNS